MRSCAPYINSLLKTALKESVMQNDIIDAIKKKYEVDITYHDGAEGTRRIQPVAYGVTDRGNLVVRAYQTGGSSMSDPQGWKEFIVDSIGDWSPRKDVTFPQPPTDPNDGPYNPNGDRKMKTVYLKADFGPESPATPSSQPQQPVQQPVQNIAPQRKESDITGIDTEQDTTGNVQSVTDMQNAFKATDTGGQATTGPIEKGSDNDATDSTGEEEDYGNEFRNGPTFKF